MQIISSRVLLLSYLCSVARSLPLLQQRSLQQPSPELYPLGEYPTTCGPLPDFQIQPLTPSNGKILKRQDALQQCFPIAYGNFTYFPDEAAPSLELQNITLAGGRNYTFSVRQSDGLFSRISVSHVPDGAGQPPFSPTFALIDSRGIAKVEGWQVERGIDNVVVSMELKKQRLVAVGSGYGIEVAVFSLKMFQDELY